MTLERASIKYAFGFRVVLSTFWILNYNIDLQLLFQLLLFPQMARRLLSTTTSLVDSDSKQRSSYIFGAFFHREPSKWICHENFWKFCREIAFHARQNEPSVNVIQFSEKFNKYAFSKVRSKLTVAAAGATMTAASRKRCPRRNSWKKFKCRLRERWSGR